MSDTWERVTKQFSQQTQPRVSVYADGDGHINAPADRALGQPDCVELLVDPETMRIALEPTDDDPQSYTISRESYAGGDICLTSALTQLGVDIAALSETVHPPVKFEDGRAIIDVSELAAESEATDGDTTSTDAESDSPDADETRFWCGTCGAGPFDSTNSVQGHHASLGHGSEVEWETSPPEDDTDAKTDDSADADETGTDVSTETVRDCASEVETLSELADLLDVSAGRARLLARDADSLTDLRDDVRRMGVSDDDD